MRMAQKCQKEVEEPGTASQHHKKPPPACCCCEGGGGGTRARVGAYALAPYGRDLHLSHAFAFNGKGAVQPPALVLGSFDLPPCIGSINPALSVVDLALGLSSACCPVQPWVESIGDPLGCSTPLCTFQPGVELAAYADTGSGGPGTWDTNYLTPAELPRLRVPVQACTAHANKWVSSTATGVAVE